MAQEQIRALLKICFTHDGHAYHPVMLEMTVTRSVLQPSKNPGDHPKVVEITTKFYVPVISIFSINALGIENVDIDFNIEITSQFEKNREEEEDDEVIGLKGSPKDKKSIELLGKLSARKITNQEEGRSFSYDRAESSTFNVNVTAGMLPLSKGLLEIIDIYTKAIHVTGMPEEEIFGD